MNMKKIIFALLLGLPLVSCLKEDEVSYKDYYANYQIVYNAPENKTIVAVLFTQDDADGYALEPLKGMWVTFNSDTLSFNYSYNQYIKEYKGKVEGTVRFCDGYKTYSNALKHADSIDYLDVLDTVYSSKDYTFRWKGNKVGTDEALYITLSNISAPFYYNKEGGDSMVFHKNYYSQLSTGSLIFSNFYRLKKESLQEKNPAGGTIFRKYWAGSDTTYLK
jgi:hypothetical protein